MGFNKMRILMIPIWKEIRSLRKVSKILTITSFVNSSLLLYKISMKYSKRNWDWNMEDNLWATSWRLVAHKIMTKLRHCNILYKSSSKPEKFKKILISMKVYRYWTLIMNLMINKNQATTWKIYIILVCLQLIYCCKRLITILELSNFKILTKSMK